MKNKTRLAIFASGDGTNAENIIKYFKKHPSIEVHSLLCNNKNAGVLERIKPYNVNPKIFNKEDLYENDEIKSYLEWFEVDFVILAGFLWMIPEALINQFPHGIINLHPALLPSYGGKGMYGMKVHEAVINNHESESGITIHLVNKRYDEGEILFQAKTTISDLDNPETLAIKIHELEHQHFPRIIEDYVSNYHAIR